MLGCALLACLLHPLPLVVQVGEPAADAVVELSELQHLLERWIEHPEWPQLPPVDASWQPDEIVRETSACVVISSRLTLFKPRFGVEARAVPGWDELAQLAAGALKRLVDELPIPEAGTEAHDDPWIGTGWLSNRALLLDVAGRGDQAYALLFDDRQRSWNGCCLFDLSHDLFFLCRARAELLDRRGDTQTALRWYHAAWYWCEIDADGDSFGRPRIEADLIKARFAQLLAETGEADAAISVIASMDDPDAEGPHQSVVRDATHKALATSNRKGAELFGVALTEEGLGSAEFLWQDWHGTAFVVGQRTDRKSWRVLACMLPLFSERSGGDNPLPDDATDIVILAPTDARVARLLRR